jgi:hypothetical protein
MLDANGSYIVEALSGPPGINSNIQSVTRNQLLLQQLGAVR